MIRYISAPNWERIDKDDKVVFLAGPIQGALGWHEEAYEIFKEEYKGEKNIVICSPKRNSGMEKTIEGYEKQVNWETQHLKRAAKNGVVFFWFADQREIVYLEDGKTQRSFGKTSRTEYGEWKAYHDLGVCENLVLGLDTEWQKEKYFKTRITQDESNITVCDNLVDTIKQTLKQL